MPELVQGWDTSVRDTISKGRLVQGAQHPRTFGQGHISRGHINPASKNGSHENATMHVVIDGILIQGIQYCCYITVDFAIDVSQNVLVLKSFPFIGKTNIFQKMTKHSIFYYFHLLS
jgi:hypothetical protein